MRVGLIISSIVLVTAGGVMYGSDLGRHASASGSNGAPHQFFVTWTDLQGRIAEAKAYLIQQGISISVDGNKVPTDVIASKMVPLMHDYHDEAVARQSNTYQTSGPSHVIVAQAAAETMINEFFYQQAVKEGRVPPLTQAQAEAQRSYNSYENSSDPNKAQAIPPDETPEQFFLSDANVHYLHLHETILAMRSRVGGPSEGSSRANERAWFHGVLEAHRILIQGMSDIPVASLANYLPSFRT